MAFYQHAPLLEPSFSYGANKGRVERVEGKIIAMQREQFYRAIILYWRRLHLFLAVITIGLIIWHLVYVVQLFLVGAFHV